jgi:hypothetical protein
LFEVGLDTLKPDKIPAFEARHAKEPAKHMGDFFRVRGKISSLRPLAIESGGDEYLLHSHDDDLRQKMRSYAKGRRLEFIGELATHRGKLQFLVAEDDWILREPRPAKD